MMHQCPLRKRLAKAAYWSHPLGAEAEPHTGLERYQERDCPDFDWDQSRIEKLCSAL